MAIRAGRDRDDLLALQMDHLYKAAPASVLSICGALMAVYVYWSPATRTGLLAFLACTVGVALIHLGSSVLRAKGRPAGFSAMHWSRVVRAIYLCSGLCWGVGGAWMLGHGEEQQALVICCLAMGAVTVTFPAVVYPPAYQLFQAPIFLAMPVGLFSSGLEYGALLALASLLLCAVAGLIGQGMGSQLILALRLSLENQALAARLEERGAALEDANRELEQQSNTDPLTGVANRRRLMHVARATRGRAALLIVDVDHFKLYNDSFGHVDGDACLVMVAQTLVGAVRPDIDLVARHGGEEFAVVLPGVDEEAAAATADAIRLGVERLHGSVPGIRRLVTVSIGMACREDGDTATSADLFERADAAVYEAKRCGRNRVVGAPIHMLAMAR